MTINDELIACYIEGKLTIEERDIVRNYLCKHPEEYERVLFLMDNDMVDCLGEQLETSGNCMTQNNLSFSDIAYSSAAFAPQQYDISIPRQKSRLSKNNELYERLGRMCNELNDII